jgi:hypothetical protein
MKDKLSQNIKKPQKQVIKAKRHPKDNDKKTNHFAVDGIFYCVDYSTAFF